ncbi:Reverse transcriptase, partial [Phytophthora palmivora]
MIGGSAERDLPGQLPAPIQEASPENRNNSPDPESDPEMHCHEGDDLYAEDVDQEMAILSEINPTTDEVKIEDIQVGDPGIQTTAEIERLRQKIWKYARPIAQRVRKIAPRFREKLSDLIKGLLSASYSRSPWASPIVVIVKKNGVDIRLCIDYRLVNSLTQLMVYPMPLVNDLLEDLDKVLWYCSLDMASGFWVVTMTDRARAISAFITPFGLFEWNRMPFGLKNAPQIYQRLIDNALYGFTRIPPPGSDPRSTNVFEVGEADDPGKQSSVYRDYAIYAAVLYELREVDFAAMSKDDVQIQIKRSMEHKELDQLDLKGDPGSDPKLKSTETHDPEERDGDRVDPRWIRPHRDYAIYAAVLYELREVDFAAMSKDDVRIQIKRSMEHKELDQLDLKGDPGSDPKLKSTETHDPEERDGDRVDPRWIRPHRAFETLKSKIASTPILRHFDADRETMVIVYASDWAISAALVQVYDQIYYPITFVLKSNELNYSPVEKEVLALLRILDLGYNMLVGRRIRALTRYSTLAWLFRSTGLQGRLGQWASLLSPWTLEIVKCVKGEEEILGVVAASITPRSRVDEALIQISPKKEPRRKIQTPIPAIRADEELYVVSFDGSARVKRGGGAYSAILWKLPEWTVIQARSAYVEDLTVNEAEYHGLLLCLDLLSTVDRKRVMFCGDSNLVIRQ